jgi:UDP-N-acetylmuramoylalanine--D-glutamate ligase
LRERLVRFKVSGMIPISTAAGGRFAVFGLARSGLTAAQALRAGGARVLCWDDGVVGRDAAADAGLDVVDLRTTDWSVIDALVLSPGVPLTHPVPHWTVMHARAAGVPVIGDVELFFRERAVIEPRAPVIAITGTNGKSTTTALTAHLLRRLGHDVAMGGNIGVGVLDLAPPASDRVHVLELSSFQLDLTQRLDATVGVFLNVTPDHLDRHGTLEAYAAIKRRLVEATGRAVIGLDDPFVLDAATVLARSKPVIGVTTRDTPFASARVCALGTSVVTADGQRFELDGIGTLRGRHNAENAAAALGGIHALSLAHPELNLWRRDELAAGLSSFGGLPHRMEELGRIGRVLVVNDSKATNADSTEKALAAFPGDIFWIAGGVPKQGGIASLAPYFPRLTRAFLIGQASAAFATTLAGHVPAESCGDLETALARALAAAADSTATEPVVLLSPACASYDQYKSFEHRGEHLRRLVTGQPGFVPPRRGGSST